MKWMIARGRRRAGKTLPYSITRACCPGKSCGDTHLYLAHKAILDGSSPTGASVTYSYRRESNDEVYVVRDSLAELAEWLEETA